MTRGSHRQIQGLSALYIEGAESYGVNNGGDNVLRSITSSTMEVRKVRGSTMEVRIVRGVNNGGDNALRNISRSTMEVRKVRESHQQQHTLTDKV